MEFLIDLISFLMVISFFALPTIALSCQNKQFRSTEEDSKQEEFVSKTG